MKGCNLACKISADDLLSNLRNFFLRKGKGKMSLIALESIVRFAQTTTEIKPLFYLPTLTSLIAVQDILIFFGNFLPRKPLLKTGR